MSYLGYYKNGRIELYENISGKDTLQNRTFGEVNKSLHDVPTQIDFIERKSERSINWKKNDWKKKWSYR